MVTAALTIGLARLAASAATLATATTGHCGRLGARKYLNTVHCFYIGLLFFLRAIPDKINADRRPCGMIKVDFGWGWVGVRYDVGNHDFSLA